MVLVVFVIWAWDYYGSSAFDPGFIEQYQEQYPVAAVGLFLLIYVIAVIAALPSLPLNLAAGFFWGGLLGGLYTALSVTLGGWIAFLLSRWLIGQPLAERSANQWVGKVQDEFARHGWKFVAFARINPIVPTGPLNYLLGLTTLSNRAFILTTFIFLLPSSIAVAYIGDTLQTLTVQQADASDVIRGMLIVSGAVTVLAAIKFAAGVYKKNRGPRENNPSGTGT